MILNEKITLLSFLSISQYPFRKLILFVGQEQVIGFEIEKHGTFEGKTYTGDLVVLTLSGGTLLNGTRKLAFGEQIVVFNEGSPYKWIQDVNGKKHPIFVCSVNEVPNYEITDLIKGN